MRPRQRGGGTRRLRLTAVSVSAALVGALCVIGGTSQGLASASTAAKTNQGSRQSVPSGERHQARCPDRL